MHCRNIGLSLLEQTVRFGSAPLCVFPLSLSILLERHVCLQYDTVCAYLNKEAMRKKKEKSDRTEKSQYFENALHHGEKKHQYKKMKKRAE